ncbi:MAG: hypothetical protein GC151_15850 [Betaproteobacteria bacterium]|nr:hypothetical protein [Betaproteobacteria bacterium]
MRWFFPLLVLSATLSLQGCGDFRAESTRREIYKLAYRTAQFQEALERCDADPKVLAEHASLWKQNFTAASEWLDIDPAVIADREKAGRSALGEDTELGCKVVLKATRISLAAADRWAERISDEEYCGVIDCR